MMLQTINLEEKQERKLALCDLKFHSCNLKLPGLGRTVDGLLAFGV